MAESPILNSEDFTIRRPLFFGGVSFIVLGLLGGFWSDSSGGYWASAVLDLASVTAALALTALVYHRRVGMSFAMGFLLYLVAANFVLALVQTLIQGAPRLEVLVYKDLFVYGLLQGLAVFVVGRSAAVVFGLMVLSVLLSASLLCGSQEVAENLWYELPIVAGVTFMLYQYRTALDKLLSDLRRVIRENKTLRDRERLAALGEMTAGFAHEIKNPLNLVVNFAESSQDLLSELEGLVQGLPDAASEEDRAYLFRELRQNLDDIRAQGLRGASTVQGMLIQARTGAGEFQAIDLNELAAECLHLAWSGHKVAAARKTFLPAESPVMVRGSRADLSRALVNLLTNALWSLRERGRQEGSAYHPELTVSVVLLGEEAQVVVADNGLGFSSQTKAQLFVPFFTTKPAGEGTGLGLPLAWEVVVDQHGGRIEVEGEAGQGARFTIILPLLGAP